MPRMNDGSKFITHVEDLTTTNDTDVYVVPNNFSSHVENLFVTNSASGSSTYTLKYYEKAVNTTHTLFTSHSVAGKSIEYLFTVDKPLYLHAGDKIIVAASTANELHVGIAAEEHFDPAHT